MERFFSEAIVKKVNEHLSRVLDVAEVGIPTKDQFQAFRKVALKEFGNQGFLMELDALLRQHGEERNGQAENAGKGVRR